MKKPTSNPDYFMQPVRGSSPAASLAADLSQNFHIDMRYAIRFEGLLHVLIALQPPIAYPTSISLHVEPLRDN
jgi:hypothetical protein